MLSHFHTNQLDFNMLDFSLICFHRKYCFPPRLCAPARVFEWRCVGVCMLVFFCYSCPWHLHVNPNCSLSQEIRRCVCKEGVLQGQNELMLNIPYWFYCNSFLILSLFNFISLRLVGMEMRSVLFSFSFLFFFCLCKLQLSPQAF